MKKFPRISFNSKQENKVKFNSFILKDIVIDFSIRSLAETTDFWELSAASQTVEIKSFFIWKKVLIIMSWKINKIKNTIFKHWTGLLHASHFCYLLANQEKSFGYFDRKSSKVVLIGADHT